MGCWLLPHPGPAVSKRSFNGDLTLLDSLFLQLTNQLVRRIFDVQLEPKRVNNRNVTAPELANFFEVYVGVFQEGSTKFPRAMTILQVRVYMCIRLYMCVSLCVALTLFLSH